MLQVRIWSLKVCTALPLQLQNNKQTAITSPSLSFSLCSMAGVEDGEVGFEEGISWLPSHVLDEAIWDTEVVSLTLKFITCMFSFCLLLCLYIFLLQGLMGSRLLVIYLEFYVLNLVWFLTGLCEASTAPSVSQSS